MKNRLKLILWMGILTLPVLAFNPAHAEDSEESSDEIECTAAAPTPMFKKADYKDHSFNITDAKTNEAEESIRVGVTTITIKYSGCADSRGREYHFLRTEPDHPGKPEMTDIQWLQKLIKDLKASERSDLDGLSDFLGKVGKSKDFKVCKNGSKPTEDGCNFEALGEYTYLVKSTKKTDKSPTKTEFILTDVDNL